MNDQVKPYPLISEAVEKGDSLEVERLFAMYPEWLHRVVPLGGNWLNFAAGYGTLDMVKYFLNKGFEIDAKAGPLNERPLGCAALNGRCEIVEYLVDQGAIIDMSSSLANPLFCAMRSDSLETVKLLMERGCDPRIKYDDQTDVFMEAREWGKIEIAQAIADPRVRDEVLKT